MASLYLSPLIPSSMRRLRQPRSASHKVALLVTGLLAVYGGYYLGQHYAPRQTETLALSRVVQAKPIPDFQLADQVGRPFNQIHLKGYWNLVVFGYLSNQEEADALLALGVRAWNRLGDNRELQDKTRLVFVTLDPEVDTSPNLRDFIARFSDRFVGLSGEEADTLRLANALGVIVHREAFPVGGYRIDHSTHISLVDPDGRLAGVFTGVQDPAQMAADVKFLSEQREQP